MSDRDKTTLGKVVWGAGRELRFLGRDYQGEPEDLREGRGEWGR